MRLTILFSKPKNHIFPIFSYIIKKFLNTQYSHCAIILSGGFLQEEQMVCEAVSSGVRMLNSRQWFKSNDIVSSYHMDLTYNDYSKTFSYIMRNCGKKYSYWQNILIFLNFDSKIKNDEMNCSEFVARLLRKHSFKFSKDINLVTPKDIYEVLNGK